MQGIDQSELVRYAQLGNDINGGLTSRIYEVTDSRTGERIAGILAKKPTIGEPASESVKRLERFREFGIPCLEIAIADEEKNILYMSDLRGEGYSLIDDTFDMHKVMSLANSDDVLIGFSTDLGKIHNLGVTSRTKFH